MYLKRIVLHGFKSFADRTELDFGRGFTAIVGPNGCGKSNILDAIRWVLGEQSARTLRGSAMADVIFAGSRSRKPGGLADVELTFDNSTNFFAEDRTEVSVGRVLYRNGDSEYRINGKSCRLRDVRDLFLDTGLGVDAYSVIEQGRVDAILRANPLQRRELFEEAAGISRYKVRRVEAQRKLERSQNNLLRLNDLLAELERRLRSVKLAAGKARRYQQHDARLRELRSTYSLAEHHRLERALRDARNRATTFEDLLQARRVDLAVRDTEAAEFQHALQTLDERIHADEQNLLEIETEISALGERAAQGGRRLEELETQREGQTQQRSELKRRAETLQQERGEQQATLETLRADEQVQAQCVARVQTQRTQAESRLKELRSEVERERSAAFETARRSSLLTHTRANLEEHIDRLQRQQAAAQRRDGELRQQSDAAAVRRGQAERRVAELDQRIGDLRARLEQADAGLKDLGQQIGVLDAQMDEARQTRSGLQSRIGLLEDLERRLEGVDEATQSVLAWRDADEPARDGGVIGLVAQVLQVNDARVSLLQPLLARFENDVIVGDGHAFLAELERRGPLPGPVGVIALDRLDEDETGRRYLDTPGVVCRAVDWVACDAQYRVLAEHLLGRVVIVDRLERALALAASAPSGFAFVTMDGEIVEPAGRLTVGAAGAAAGLISRKTETHQLREELDEVETRLEHDARQRATVQDKASDLQVDREAALSDIAAVQRRHAEAQTELARLHDACGRLTQEIRDNEAEIGECESALAQARERAGAIEREAQQSAQAEQDHEARLAERERLVGELVEQVERVGEELTQAQVQAGRAAERRRAREDALRVLEERAESAQQERAACDRQIEEIAERIEAGQCDLAEAQRRRTELSVQSERLRAGVLARRRERQGLKERLEACGATVRRLHEDMEGIEQALHACEVGLREVEVRRENLIARVRDELDVDLVDLYGSYEHAEQDWEAIRAEIEDLRGKIARLGHVNLDAIAELEELEPRHENLTAQRDDLLESIRRLESLITELDQESRTRFLACFEEVREHFRDLFRKLFGGGRADIVLEDSEQPLECGIEVVARPPGKEPQTLSLLSGGEKTLAAVALLFAVFKRKPSPFAILDEVDAALDESNIERFNKVLGEFLARSQFVVITHNKRTMQNADALYGVTMEEPGVSKRVAVRFEDRVDTPSVA